MELGKRLAEIRRQSSMTQEELAEMFHVTRQTISNWENGKSYPDIATLVCISDEFHVSLDTLLKGDNEMVREITKEQIHGKKQKRRLIIAGLGVLIVVFALMLLLRNTVTMLKPEDYNVTVKEVTLENVSIDKANKIATYKDLEGGEYVMEDESKENGGYYEAPNSCVYVFDGEEYASLMTYGKAYEVVVTSDKRIDGWYVGDGEEKDSLEIEVWRSNRNLLKPDKRSRFMVMQFDDISRIYDGDDVIWERSGEQT